jgi:PRTRC genetic system protein A
MGAALYEYVLAADGVYVRGSRPGLEVMFQIGKCEVRGLAHVEAVFKWRLPIVSEEIVRAIWLHSEQAAEQGLEKLFHLCWDGETFRLEIPDQTQTSASCRPLDSGPESSHARALIEIHSHHEMPAFFSGTDNKDEQGFRIYGVIGRVFSAPELRARVGCHGYFWEIPARWVMEMPQGLKDCNDS